jgi:antitoxin ParD1/3/4
MSNVEKISIALPRDMVKTIRDAVEEGGYATTSEVIRDALRNWSEDRAYEQAIKTYGIERLRRLVQEGIDSGPSVPAAKVFDRLEAKYAAMAKPKRKRATRK